MNPNSGKKILYVDDDKGLSRLVTRKLEGFGYKIETAETGGEGLKKFSSGGFDIIIVDFMLPDVDGIGLLKAFGPEEMMPPVIMLTAFGNAKTAIDALKNGASDYLIKDIDQNFLELLPGVINASLLKKELEEENTKHKESLEFYARELERKNEELKKIAYYDSLTGLGNRAVFFATLKHAIARARRNNMVTVLFYMDLDGFKMINDTYGHTAGDEVLREVARKLREMFRESDSIFRLGGDEFAVILEGVKDINDCDLLINKVIEKISDPIIVDGQERKIGTSIGIAYYPGCGESPEDIVKYADAAMYIAKKESGNSFRFYTEEMNKKAIEFSELKRDLHPAISSNQFILEYQPKFVLQNNEVSSVEVLIRWKHPVRGIITPSVFIPVAEKSGFITDITEWVLKTIFAQSIEWEKLGYKKIKFAIKISAYELRRQDLVQRIENISKEWGFDLKNLIIEVTEKCLVDSLDRIRENLAKLRDKGASVAIDDFGVGHTSLSLLKYLPIDIIKIDKSFISNITTDETDAALVKATIDVSHTMKLKVIAEGVETKEQVEFLRKNGCDEAQGLYLSKPVPSSEVEKLIL